jgi:hypothetical protein
MNQPDIVFVFPGQLSTCWLESPVGHPTALFNLTEDPFELQNLLNDPAQISRITPLLDNGRQWAAHVGITFTKG